MSGPLPLSFYRKFVYKQVKSWKPVLEGAGENLVSKQNSDNRLNRNKS